jgi:hypothetical protein
MLFWQRCMFDVCAQEQRMRCTQLSIRSSGVTS